MSYTPRFNFDELYTLLPTAVIDFETTGLPPNGRACQVGIARFERGACVASLQWYINPGCPIPEEATEIHGITDEHVDGAPSVYEVFEPGGHAQKLLDGAQPLAYNASHDRLYMPHNAPIDPSWPWLDALTLVRKVDRYAKGPGRHKLGAVCERHGIVLAKAHSAEADARAAGEVFYKLMPKVHVNHDRWSIGELLYWMRCEEAESWRSFHSWLAKQTHQQQEHPQ